MGYNKGNRPPKAPPFVMLPWDILNSNAFKKMRKSTRSLLPYFLGKARFRHNDLNIYNKQFEFTFSEASRYGYSSSTYYDAVTEFRSHGFIDKVFQGGSHGDFKAANLYRLSERWRKFGTPEFVESDRAALNEYTKKNTGTG